MAEQKKLIEKELLKMFKKTFEKWLIKCANEGEDIENLKLTAQNVFKKSSNILKGLSIDFKIKN